MPVPGAAAAGVPDYIDGLLGAFSVRPPQDLGRRTRPRAGSAGARPSTTFHRLTALDELAWRMRIEGSCGRPEREFNGPVVGSQQRYRDGLAALGADFATLEPTDQVARLRSLDRLHRPALRPRVRGDVRGPRVRRATAIWPAGGPSASTATSSPGAGPTRRCPTRDRRRHHRRIGTRRRHGRRRAHRGRLDGDHRREGPQPPAWTPTISTRPAFDYSNDEIKFHNRYFLGPDPLIEPRTFRTREDDGGAAPRRRGQLGADHGRGRRYPCRRQGAPVPSRRLPVLSVFGPQPDADVADWPLDYDELEPYYAEVERAIGVAGTEGANPFAAPRSGPFPMPSGAPMFGATRSAAAAERLGYHPYAAPTAANSVPYDGRPACNNCGFCAFFGCPIHAKGDPIAMLLRAMATGRAELLTETFVSRIRIRGSAGHRGGRRSAPTGWNASCPPVTWSWRPGPSRRPGCSCCPEWSTICWAGTS